MYIHSVFHRKIVLLRESEKCSSRGLFILFLLRNILVRLLFLPRNGNYKEYLLSSFGI